MCDRFKMYQTTKVYYNHHESDAYQNAYPTQLIQNDDFDTFLEAAKLGELSGIKSYLQRNPHNINGCDSNGTTALMFAASHGHYNIIKSLLDSGANCNLKEYHSGRTALMMAASNGHTRCIEMLVQGKADTRLKDNNNCTAAYFASHNGHGNNKIIARLLKIPSNNNNQFLNSFSNSNCMNSSFTSKYSNSHSIDSPTSNYSSNDRYNNIVHNNSLQDNDNDLSHYSSFNTSTSDHYSNGSDRRYSFDMSSPFMQNAHQSTIQEILKRNPSRPRALFKQRTKTQTPVSQHHQQQQSQLLQDAMNGISLSGTSSINSGNKDVKNNLIQSTVNNMVNKSSYSFGSMNQMLQNLEQQQPTNTFRSNSLSLHLGSQRQSNSPNRYSPEIFHSMDKNSSFYDSVFESPQNNHSEQQSFTEKSNQSKVDLYNLNVSWDSLADNANKPRNKPRNSTFVSNGNSSLLQAGSEEFSSLEIKFAGLANNLDEFLNQQNLGELSELFAKKNIGLYTFLSMAEDELKNTGVQNPEHLATLIAAQLKFKEQIGVESLESMYYICYLGDRLDKTKRENNILKKEYEMYKLGL